MSPTTTILPATTSGDFVNLGIIAKAIWEEHYKPMIGLDQTAYMIQTFQSPTAIAHQVENEGYLYFHVRQGDASVGYFCIRPEKKALFLSKYYILKEHRNQGLGRIVMDFCVDYAQKHDLKKIRLTVNRKNKDTIDKYLHMGFAMVGEQDTPIGQGYEMNDYLLEKNV